jgi:small subunit ribosomal protein S21
VDFLEDLGCSPAVLVFASGTLALTWKRPGKRLHVTIDETDRLDFVLKKFRRQVTKAGLFQDMKRKRFYESPAALRRRKSKAARRRNRHSQHYQE